MKGALPNAFCSRLVVEVFVSLQVSRPAPRTGGLEYAL